MLSRVSRVLTYVVAAGYTVAGGILFLFPVPMAPVFAWKVTPFITMTIGGWSLGYAWMAWINARRWQWRLVYTSLISLWVFGLFEAGVLFAFRSKLSLGHPIAWIYLAAVALNLITALVGIVDWLRIRPETGAFGLPMRTDVRIFTAAFVLFVAFLALYGLLAANGAGGTRGGVFPEMMTVFTLRAFGAFYLSLALAAIPLIWERSLAPALNHGYGSYGLIVAITAAAFIHIRLFDFVGRPGGLAYFGAYLIVGVPLLFVFRRFGTGSPEPRAT
jgi:hypothetical protein